MDASEVMDLEDFPPSVQAKVLKKLVRRLMAKRLSERDPEEQEKDQKEVEKRREELSNLHEEKRGAAPKVAVTKDDLSADLLGEEEEEEEDLDEKPKKRG
jgi:hypothetical protein